MRISAFGIYLKHISSFREDGLTFGTYLFIDKVKTEDYGTYVCKISKPGKSKLLEVELREKGKF